MKLFTITSLSAQQADAERLLTLSRGHWSIENRSHYVRDMLLDEDRHQLRKGKGPQMMACLRNFAISLLRMMNFKISRKLLVSLQPELTSP